MFPRGLDLLHNVMVRAEERRSVDPFKNVWRAAHPVPEIIERACGNHVLACSHEFDPPLEADRATLC